VPAGKHNSQEQADISVQEAHKSGSAGWSSKNENPKKGCQDTTGLGVALEAPPTAPDQTAEEEVAVCEDGDQDELRNPCLEFLAAAVVTGSSYGGDGGLISEEHEHDSKERSLTFDSIWPVLKQQGWTERAMRCEDGVRWCYIMPCTEVGNHVPLESCSLLRGHFSPQGAAAQGTGYCTSERAVVQHHTRSLLS
jgi:hypothetical protein